MATHATTWEDDDCNRIVHLSIDYQLIDNRVEIEDVTPTSIRFLDADAATDRQIRIWTEKGRRLLSQQLSQRLGAAQLRQQIESELELVGAAL